MQGSLTQSAVLPDPTASTPCRGPLGMELRRTGDPSGQSLASELAYLSVFVVSPYLFIYFF